MPGSGLSEEELLHGELSFGALLEKAGYKVNFYFMHFILNFNKLLVSESLNIVAVRQIMLANHKTMGFYESLQCLA